MNEMIVKRNALLAQKVIKGLESRNMSGYYAETKEEALTGRIPRVSPARIWYIKPTNATAEE